MPFLIKAQKRKDRELKVELDMIYSWHLYFLRKKKSKYDYIVHFYAFGVVLFFILTKGQLPKRNPGNLNKPSTKLKKII